MNRLFLCALVALAAFPGMLRAEEFLGAPIIPGGKTTIQTESRLEQLYDIPVAEAVEFYQRTFKEQKDLKFRDRRNEIHIEDHSNRQWHSITIGKSQNGQTEIVIVKDNWTWVIGTLILRFVGVFVVLSILYVALSISGAIIPRILEARAKALARQTSQPRPVQREI